MTGADGKRNTLGGFKRKEFRGKLAIAITANFINHQTTAEARVEEISGVAFIFNQKFFKVSVVIPCISATGTVHTDVLLNFLYRHDHSFITCSSLLVFIGLELSDRHRPREYCLLQR